MAQFIRCIEGHVFDAGTATVCPICGAVVEFTPPVDATPPETPIVDGTGVAASAMLRTPVLGAVAAGVLCVGIAALFFALRETRPATTNQASASAVASLSASQLGDPLQMALFVTRMLTSFDQKHYSRRTIASRGAGDHQQSRWDARQGSRFSWMVLPAGKIRSRRAPVDECRQTWRSEFGAVARPFERARNRRPAKF